MASKRRIGAISVFLVTALGLSLVLGNLVSSAELSTANSEPTPSNSTTIVPALLADPHLDKTPPRATKGLDLEKLGWRYDCMECHKAIEPKWEMNRLWVEHKEVRLQHGNNRFCLNCHHPENRNAFKDDDGTEIEEQNVVQLCARCHGTTHRDWVAGVHGRKNGYWDSSKGEQTKLRCIQCHDPHEPAFPILESLPAPHYPNRAATSDEPKDSDH